MVRRVLLYIYFIRSWCSIKHFKIDMWCHSGASPKALSVTQHLSKIELDRFLIV